MSMKLKRKKESLPASPRGSFLDPVLERRSFLKKAGIGLGAGVAATMLPKSLVREAGAAAKKAKPPMLEQIKTICSNCAVGCGVIGEVKNGTWVSQEPWFEHPINTGSLCSKGAAAREHVISEKRLKYPMKLEGGKWKRLTWDQALGEIATKLQAIRKKHGPDSLMLLGSAHHNNEMAYSIRKFAALMGSNNIDHQARICHSTTVAGLANVWGYGAMTNSMNDIRNTKSILMIGENAAESHPISMQHILHAKEVNSAKFMVIDPRFTKTAAFANIYVRHRSGTDVAFIYGLINIILANGWEDKQFLNDRTYNFEKFHAVIKKYTPEVVSDITGVSVAELNRVAKTMADNRPGTVIWAMGGTQHTNGTSNTRAYCYLQLVLGNMGVPGGGTNVFRGHDNVQGATDLGVLSNTLPGYYGLSQGAFKHWAKVWDLDFGWLSGRFLNKKMMGSKGFTVGRWHEGAIQDPKKELSNAGVNIHAAIYWGHASNCQSQYHRVKKGLEKVELLIDIDPFVSNTAILPDRKDNVYILPAATQYEQYGSVTNSNRDIQWRNRIVSPVWESRTDLAILLDLAERLGVKDKLVHSRKGNWKGVPKTMKNVKELPEETLASIMDEWNLGMRTIGMVGQTYKRLKRQMEWAHTFRINDKRAEGGPVNGEFWGLSWPCWSEKHPGTPILYRTGVSVMDGGMGFRARWGTKGPDGNTLLAASGSAPKGSSIKGGYAQRKNWKTDITGKVFDEALAQGLAPYGNGRARFDVWNIKYEPIPVHREPLHSARPDLIARYPTYDDVKNHYRVPTLYKSLQKTSWVKDFPIILTTGRQVEFEGGGASERAAWWLVELQPEMYAEINPKLANDLGIRNGEFMWVESPPDWGGSYGGRVRVKAKVTRRVGPDTIFLPFHWGGSYDGKSLAHKYPAGTVPYGIGESANTVTNYGYDRGTQMPETKTGLCRIRKATEV